MVATSQVYLISSIHVCQEIPWLSWIITVNLIKGWLVPGIRFETNFGSNFHEAPLDIVTYKGNVDTGNLSIRSQFLHMIDDGRVWSFVILIFSLS